MKTVGLPPSNSNSAVLTTVFSEKRIAELGNQLNFTLGE